MATAESHLGLVDVAAIATAVSVSVTLLLQVVWRFFDARRAMWQVYGGYSDWFIGSDTGPDIGPEAGASLSNVGDGHALAVRVVGLGCTVILKFQSETGGRPTVGVRGEEHLRARLASGDEVGLVIFCEPGDWSQAAVAVIWTISPARMGRWSRRVKLIDLPQIASRPIPTRRSFEAGRGHVQEVVDDPPNPAVPSHVAAVRQAPPSKSQIWQRARLRRELKRL